MAFGAALAGVGAAFGVGSAILGAASDKKAAKEAEKTAKKQAKLQLESTKAEAEFSNRSTQDQINFEEAATSEKTNLDANQAVAKAAMEATQQGAKIGLAVGQSEGNAAREYAKIEAAIYQNRQMSAIRQGQQARDARTAAERSKAIGLEHGVGAAGSAGQVIRQNSIHAEYARLVGNYEVELGVRGMRLDEASTLARASDARAEASLAVGQLNESTSLAYSQIADTSAFTLRQSAAGAAMSRKQASEARDLQVKYAEIGAKFEIDTAGDRYKSQRDTISQQMFVNIGASLLGGAADAKRFSVS
jgi:hypothetical protein